MENMSHKMAKFLSFVSLITVMFGFTLVAEARGRGHRNRAHYHGHHACYSDHYRGSRVYHRPVVYDYHRHYGRYYVDPVYVAPAPRRGFSVNIRL